MSRTTANGKAMTIQPKNETSIPKDSERMAAMATFGGVPTNVATPPMLAAYAVASRSAGSIVVRCEGMWAEIDRAMGSIIKAVAVFEIHMLRKAVASMNPSTILRPEVPVWDKIANATRRWTSHFSRAKAIRKPPRKRYTYGEPYAVVTASIGSTPVAGRSKMGNNEVTAMGSTSAIHHTSIHITDATAHAAEGVQPTSAGSRDPQAMNTAGPASSRPVDFISR